jgi:protein-S-isoprenylcysteine O-methyltransferase Ste14
VEGVIAVPPPLLALLAALAQRALARGATAPTPPRVAAAATIAVASVSIAGASARQLLSHGTTVEPFHPDRSSFLVTSGANSISRNPMYVGLAGLLAANAIRRGSWVAVVPLAAFVLVIDRFQIRTEEAALRANFGAEYENYCADVPRWLDHRSIAGSLAIWPRR